MDPANHSDLLSVSEVLLYLSVNAPLKHPFTRYFTLFIVYTPYTVYKCQLSLERDGPS